MNSKTKNNSKLKTSILLLISAVLIAIFAQSITAASGYNVHSRDFGATDVVFLNQDPDPAEPGDYLELRWKVVKYGNAEVTDLTYTLDLEYPFYFDSSDTATKQLGDWYAYSDDNEYYTLYYKVRVDDDAVEDTYTLKLIEKNNRDQGTTVTEHDVRVADNTKPTFSIGTLTTSPVKLVADTEEAQLDIQINNIGDEDAENVVVEIELPEGFTATYGYSDRANLGSIEMDDSATATFYVDVAEDVTTEEHTATLHISYKEENDDDNEYKTIEMPIEIPVKKKALFEIESVESKPAELRAGNEIDLHVKVTNVGSEDAESVSLRAFKESSQPFDFDDKTDYIGKLAPGETGEAVLKFMVEEDAVPKKYIMDVEVRSVADDEVMIEEESIVLEVLNGEKKSFFRNPETGGMSAGAIVLIVILAVMLAGAGGYFMGRKK